MTAATARPISVAVLHFLGKLVGAPVEFDVTVGSFTGPVVGVVEAVTDHGDCRVRVTPTLSYIVSVDDLRDVTSVD